MHFCAGTPAEDYYKSNKCEFVERSVIPFMVRKTPLFAPFMHKCIILPRQAWDKHRETSKKSGVFRRVTASELTPSAVGGCPPRHAPLRCKEEEADDDLTCLHAARYTIQTGVI